MRDALLFPIGRFCLIRVWIQLSCNTSVPVPRFLAVIWPPAGYIAWVLSVSENEMGPPLGRETKSFLFAGVPWWLAYCFGDWAMTCVKHKKRYPFGPPREVHSLEKHANSKLFPRARAYQHRTTMILNLGDVSYKIHTTSKTNLKKYLSPISWTSVIFIQHLKRFIRFSCPLTPLQNNPNAESAPNF